VDDAETLEDEVLDKVAVVVEDQEQVEEEVALGQDEEDAVADDEDVAVGMPEAEEVELDVPVDEVDGDEVGVALDVGTGMQLIVVSLNSQVFSVGFKEY
jgi:hypothetical protein